MTARPTPLLSAAAMRSLDRFTIESGTASLELMERAGRSVAAYLTGNAAALVDGRSGPRMLVLAGRGSNGGDGFVVARLMAASGWRVDVQLAAGQPAEGSDAAVNLERWEKLGQGPTLPGAGTTGYDLVLDTLFGTGLDRELDGELRRLVEALNAAHARDRFAVVAVDLPSGLDADSGRPLGAAVEADATVTIGAGKPGLFLGEGIAAAGRVSVADIGLADPVRAGIEVSGEVLDEAGCRRFLRPRRRDTHKGSQGHVLIIGGSAGKTGAAKLAARAALRAGAGLVSVAVPASVAAAVDAEFTETMTIALADRGGEPDTGAIAGLADQLERFDVVVAGPGLGTSAGAGELVEALAATVDGALVLDADALNLVAAGAGTSALTAARKGRALTLTPHPGEMARLLGTGTASVQDDRLGSCQRLLGEGAATVVLKGAATVVAATERLAFNSSGNPGMATAGMGDVLAGAVGALAAGMDSFEAAALAVYLHGRAADILAETTGGAGFLAGEVADTLPAAIAGLQRAATRPA